MNWLFNILQKEAQRRRFKPDDSVRFFTSGRKGKGRGIVLTPNFQRGKVRDFDPQKRHYRVSTEENKEIMVHPRNMVHETLPIPQQAPQQQAPQSNTSAIPTLPLI